MESQRRQDTKLTVVAADTERLAKDLVDSAFKVHSHFGAGMLESIYESALCHELTKRGIPFVNQLPIPVEYDGQILGNGFKVDIMVSDQIILELKACEKLLPIHRAQTLSYLRLTNKPLGFLINFNNQIIKNGIVRIINDRFDPLCLSDSKRI